MANCSNCGAAVKSRPINNADLLTLGVPVLIKHGISNIYCPKCKLSEMSVPDMAGLVAAAALALASAPYKLNAQEIKFLRKSIGLPAKALAESLDVAPETISRWENDKQVIGDAQERLLRLQVVSKLAAKAPGVSVTLEDILGLKINPLRLLDSKPSLSFERSPQHGLLPTKGSEGLYQRAC